MEPLCNRLQSLVEKTEPNKILKINQYEILFFRDKDLYDIFVLPYYAFCDEAFLSFVIKDKSGDLFGVPLRDMANKNISWITDISFENNILKVGHWDGYLSRFDPESNFKLIEQIFTK